MSDLLEVISNDVRMAHALTRAHGREALFMRPVLGQLLAVERTQRTSTQTHWPETLRVQHVRRQVHTGLYSLHLEKGRTDPIKS